MNTHQFSRRTFLRGVGVTMALPWLESLPVWGDEPKAAKASEAPVRGDHRLRVLGQGDSAANADDCDERSGPGHGLLRKYS